MTKLTYKYSKDNSKLFLFCEKEKYQSILKSINGEWIIYNNKDQFVVSVKEKEELDKILNLLNEENNKKINKYKNPIETHSFYKSFATKPVNFEKILRKKSSSFSSSDDISLSSSSCGSSSSSDDFPSPGTPHRSYSEAEIYQVIDLVNGKLPLLEHNLKKLEKKVSELSTLVLNQK